MLSAKMCNQSERNENRFKSLAFSFHCSRSSKEKYLTVREKGRGTSTYAQFKQTESDDKEREEKRDRARA